MPMAVSMAELPSSPLSFEPDVQSDKFEQKRRIRDIINNLSLGKWRNRESPTQEHQSTQPSSLQTPSRPFLGRRASRKGVVGVPRSTTFRRQEDEQRKNLTPIEPSIKERRDASKVRQRALSAVPAPGPLHPPRREKSVPENLRDAYPSIAEHFDPDAFPQLTAFQPDQELPPPPPPPPQPPPQDPNVQDDPPASEASYDDAIDEELMEELKKKWILNLSMHFRDKSPREKFFLTYAETLDRWRRVTVSCDYRDAPLDSLEHDLQELHYQKDKSARIYESIRMSLPDIQFYDTVTNLKLETKEDRLHVHVTEDVNEIIPYPHAHLVQHLPCRSYKESELHFDEHMSGFVYRVNVGSETWIKKEIPGPDSVDEFLYEANALSELIGSPNVIQLKGLVIDDEGKLIKGLLLGYAEQGALIDILYDSKEGHIPKVSWERRERWARQIIQGLSEIHEAGFVQGDFTLSNIVVDEKDEAQIIDINRRGCPVGWESPEMVPLVESGQRLSMYIGVKSDLYQLGMVLWALAMEQDEPERSPRPLTLHNAGSEIPKYFKVLTDICLSPKPKGRFAAKDLLSLFSEPASFSELHRGDKAAFSEASRPATSHQDVVSDSLQPNDDLLAHSFGDRDTRYRELNHRISELRHQEPLSRSRGRRESPDMDDEGFRGRRYSPSRTGSVGAPLEASPPLSISPHKHYLPRSTLRQLSFNDRTEQVFSGQSEDGDAQIIPISPSGDPGWEEINMDGAPYLVHRDTLDDFEDFENIEDMRRGKGVERWRRHVEHLDHVDSGLADMDLADFRPPDRQLVDLAGVGDHANASIGPPRTDITAIEPQPTMADSGAGIQLAREDVDRSNEDQVSEPQNTKTQTTLTGLGSNEQQQQHDTKMTGVLERQTDNGNKDQFIGGSNPPQGSTEDLSNTKHTNDENGRNEVTTANDFQ